VAFSFLFGLLVLWSSFLFRFVLVTCRVLFFFHTGFGAPRTDRGRSVSVLFISGFASNRSSSFPPPGRLAIREKNSILEFFFSGTRRHSFGSRCRKRSDGRGGRRVRFGSIHRIVRSRPDTFLFSVPTKKEKKKAARGNKIIPLSLGEKNDPESSP